MTRYKIPPQYKKLITERVRQFLVQEWECEINGLAAYSLVEMMAEELGPHIYNQAIAHAIKTMDQRLNLLEEDLYALEVPVPPLDDQGRKNDFK